MLYLYDYSFGMRRWNGNIIIGCIGGDQKVDVVEVKLLIQVEGQESLEW